MDPKAIGAAITAKRTQLGLSQDELAARARTSQTTIDRIEAGAFKRLPSDLPKIAAALDLRFPDLDLERLAPGSAQQPQNYRAPPEYLGERDLPVYASAEGGPGEMVVSTDPIEWVQRPWYLKDVKDGFAVLIVGDSMIPVFDPGDLAVVNPRLPPMRGKDVILVADETDGEFKASIKRMLRWTERDWHLRQFNPPPRQKAEFTLSRKEWPKALRVVGKYYGG